MFLDIVYSDLVTKLSARHLMIQMTSPRVSLSALHPSYTRASLDVTHSNITIPYSTYILYTSSSILKSIHSLTLNCPRENILILSYNTYHSFC